MNPELGFEWDADKDRANRAKHGVNFEEVLSIFDGPTLTKIDDRRNYGEVRQITTGMLSPETVSHGPYRSRREDSAHFGPQSQSPGKAGIL